MVVRWIIWEYPCMHEAKYYEIADKLESQIAKSRWKSRLPGVAALSKEFGVNSRTVCKALRVLSDKGKIDIRPSSGAYIRSSPLRKKYGTIGVLGTMGAVGGPIGPKTSARLAVVDEEARKRGYHVLNVDYSRDAFQANPDALLDIPADGFLFTNCFLNVDIVKRLIHARIPFISANRISDVDGVNWIDFDWEKALTKALHHLIELGHSRIASVSFATGLQEHDRRIRETFQAVLEPRGFFDPALLIHDVTQMDYYRRYGEYYRSMYGMEKASYLMQMPSRPTAVICGGTDAANAFIHQAQKLGLSVPHDLSVVAITQEEESLQQEKFLTMISCSIREKLRLAAAQLLEIVETPRIAPFHKLMQMDFIIQQSTGHASHHEQGE